MSTDSDSDHRDPERDAWLRAALRHAPDAGVGAPASVTQTILHQARAATVSVASRQPAHSTELPLQNFWSWLVRPSVAAGFASVMAATVVGLMWWDRPIEEALPPRDAQVDAATAPPPAAPATVTAAAEPARPDALPSRAAAVATAPAPARKAAPVVVAPPPAMPAPALQRDLATAKSAAPAGAAAPTQPNPSTAVAEAEPRARESAERREAAIAPAAPAALNVAPQADAAARTAAANAISTPGLSNLRFEIRGRPQAWTWQRDEGEAREIDDALQDWIVQADRVTHPQWTHGTSAGGISATLRFTRGGVVRAVLRIGPTGLQLTRGGKTESAEITAGQAAALLSGLDALGH